MQKYSWTNNFQENVDTELSEVAECATFIERVVEVHLTHCSELSRLDNWKWVCVNLTRQAMNTHWSTAGVKNTALRYGVQRL